MTHVEALRVRKGAPDAREEPDGPQVDVLVERAPDRDQEPPERQVVGHAGVPDGAEEDRVALEQLVSPSSGMSRPSRTWRSQPQSSSVNENAMS